jgi:thioredoxin-like negative regulator of GroEL
MTARARLLSTTLLVAACSSASAPSVNAPPNGAPPAGAPPIMKATEPIWSSDPDAAFAQARAKKTLLLVDLWAPWCHTCLSMQAEVLHPRVVPELGSVVLLQVDTEREQTASFLQKYPVAVWPTFYVIDPENGEVRGRWLGGASPEQLGHFLRDALGEANGALAHLRRGDALAAQKRLAEAEGAYRAALAEAPKGWPRRPDALVALISALLKQKHYQACLELAEAETASLSPSVSAVDFASSAATCAEREPQAANVTRVRRSLETLLAASCDSAAPGASADDRADACANLRDVRSALGDRPAAERAAEQALAAIASASDGKPPDTQLIYDWERTASLTFLGRREEAIARLREREQQLPKSYNPSHYLARLYRDAHDWQPGLDAIERALSKAYGPRRAGFLGIKVDLLLGAGRNEEARATLAEQLAAYRALPEAQRLPDAEAAVEKRLRAQTESR